MSQAQVMPVRRAPLCRFCKRELIISQVRGRGDPKFTTGNVVLKCPKHGSLGRGERYLTGYVTA